MSNNPDANPRKLHPAYFETHFRPAYQIVSWPEEFVIISAYATTGEEWSRERNEQADEGLRDELEELGVWHERVEGFHPVTGHTEPSWAAAVPFKVGCELGLQFGQDAIFHVHQDLLSVSRCNEERTLVPIGSFRERTHEAADMLRRLRSDPGRPWRHLTAERLALVIDGHLDASGQAPSVRDSDGLESIGVPFGKILLEALPDGEVRSAAREELAEDYLLPEDLAALLPDVDDLGWVVECWVTDHMVSGVWGLHELRVGRLGVLCYMPDFGATDERSPPIVAAWHGLDSAQVRHNRIVEAYKRLWDRVGLPPRSGQWVDGDAPLLASAVLAALGTEEGGGYWPVILGRIRDPTTIETAELDAVGSAFGLSTDTLNASLERIAVESSTDPTPPWHRTSEERHAMVALYLACIMRRSPVWIEQAR